MGITLRRIAAFTIDLLILGIVGFCLGLLFSEYFYRIGNWGRLIGFVIAFAYFVGCSCSRIGKGQTIGKKLLSIKVVDLDNQLVSFKTASVRYAFLLIPYYVSGMNLSVTLMVANWFVATVMTLVSVYLVITAYFIVFNSSNKRTIHDYVSRTSVVGVANSVAIPVQPIWGGHFVVFAVVSVLIFGIYKIAGGYFNLETKIDNLVDVAAKIEASEIVKLVPSISLNTGYKLSKTDQGSITTVRIAASVYEMPSDDTLYKKIAEIIINNIADIESINQIQILLVKSYDIGIYSSSISYNNVASVDEWKSAIAGGNNLQPASKGMNFNF